MQVIPGGGVGAFQHLGDAAAGIGLNGLKTDLAVQAIFIEGFHPGFTDVFGGAVYLANAKLVDHSSIYTMNTAGDKGGALCLASGSHSSLFDSSLVSNTAGDGGGGIFIFGVSSYPSFLYLSSVTLQSNKQTGGGTISSRGGGGLYVDRDVSVTLEISDEQNHWQLKCIVIFNCKNF